MKRVSEDEYATLMDHADDVSREAWLRLQGFDASAAIWVIGTLLANVEDALGSGWTRELILEEACAIADSCDQPRGLSADTSVDTRVSSTPHLPSKTTGVE